MARLRRLAFRVVWVNPAKRRGIRATGRGMAAALPHVDAFVSGHSLAAFDEVLAAIAAADPGHPDQKPAGLPPSKRAEP